MTPTELIAWLDRRAVAYDLLREVHVRNDATIAAAIAQVQAKTIADAADELRRIVASDIPCPSPAANV